MKKPEFVIPEHWSIPKVFKRSKTQRDLTLSAATVYDLARHYYTIQEICDLFDIEKPTLLNDADLHEAYNQGKNDAMQKPRMLLRQLFVDFQDKDLSDPKLPVHNLLKAMELHARKYEGLVDRTIEKKPSISEMQFDPLRKE